MKRTRPPKRKAPKAPTRTPEPWRLEITTATVPARRRRRPANPHRNPKK